MAGINIGSNAIAGGYLGSTPLVSAYIGADQIWSSGPFTGLTITRAKEFKASGGTADIKVKSAADWTLATNDSWLTIGTASGTSGTSAVTITAATYTSETEDRTGYITATTSALSAVCTVTQKKVQALPSSNQVWYTSSDGNIITPNQTTSSYWGANLLTNTYTDGLGIMTFDGNVTKVPYRAYTDKSKLTSITLPLTVTQLGGYCFAGTSLNDFQCDNDFTNIDNEALAYPKNEDGIQHFRAHSVQKFSHWSLNCQRTMQSFIIEDASNLTQWFNPSFPSYSPLDNCNGLQEIRMPGMSVSFKISDSTALTATALVTLFNDLATVSNKTLQIGSTNLAKLSAQQKAIATDKGWTLT